MSNSGKIQGAGKARRYGWVIKDQPGTMMTLHKNAIKIDQGYQRDIVPAKVKEITANWSWLAFGAIVVAYRDGEYWAIDGQHRVVSARRRSDITLLPCIVFETEDVKQEARGFLDLNAGRKPVSAIDKFNAMIAAGDETAVFVHETMTRLGVILKRKPAKGLEFKSIAWAIKRAGENRDRFDLVMEIAVQLCQETPIHERLVDGLWYIDDRIAGGIGDKRFLERLHTVGPNRLVEAAIKASAYFAVGGARVWATGMIEEINKGLRNKFVLRTSQIEKA